MFRMKDKAIDGFDRVKLQRNFLTYTVLAMALGAMTFFGVCDPGGQLMGPRGSAAVVAGEVISRSDFDRAYRSMYERMQRMYSDSFDPSTLRLAHQVMKELVDDRVLYVRAIDLGLRATDDEVIRLLSAEDIFKDEATGKYSSERFQDFLRGNGYTEASFMEEVRRNVTLQKLRRFIAETSYVSTKAAELDFRLSETKIDVEYLKFDPQKVEVALAGDEVSKFLGDEKNKARVKEYYDSNSHEFNQPEQIHARHILVSFQGARNATADAAKRSKDDARKRADELLQKVSADGADFVAIAKESTDESAGKATGGDLKWFSRDAMDKAFSDAAFALEKGKISTVVESPFGFHIIKLEDRKAAVTTTLEQAQNKIAENLLLKDRRPEAAKAQANAILEQLNAGKDAADLLGQYKVAWAATGEVSADARFIPGIGSGKEISEAVMTLTKAGEVHKTPVDVRGSLYVIRLKSRKDADMSKFDKEKKKEMAMSAAYMEGNTILTTFEKVVREEMEKADKIWMNPEYLALDDRKNEAAGAGG